MNWTKEQDQVIRLRDRNILVSAAAGSGKTAVLVERIIQKILDPGHPVDIDRMLVVTFTNAAAAEMRERISLAISKQLDLDPGNEHLQRQSTLVHFAQITTIHSFCLNLIRSYFHKIDLEPNFRIGEEGELNLLREDVMDLVLQRNYEGKDPAFFRFVETFATGKSDQNLKKLIEGLYHYSMSNPWPGEWLKEIPKAYRCEDVKALEEAPWMNALLGYLKAVTGDLEEMYKRCLQLARDEDGPDHYQKRAEEELQMLQELKSCQSYLDFSKALPLLEFQRLPANRRFEGDPRKLELFKELRDEVKGSIKKLKEQFFYEAPEEICLHLSQMEEVAEEFCRLTQEFADEFKERKRASNLLDFNDLEHLAISILIQEDTKEPTATAKVYQDLFEEIMIDEYQDSNLVQESLLFAVSREGKNQFNRFMVGDVKQSIYRFRLARPEIFMEKYDSYTQEDSREQKIELRKNFRSRKEVLEFTNDICYLVMKKSLGRVEYDEKSALYPGADYPLASDMEPELLIADLAVKEGEEEQKKDKLELEGALIAQRIKALMESGEVTDKKSGALRKVKYSDIVILLRSLGNTADSFLSVLEEQGIPAHLSSKTGYFKTVEIQTMLSFLRILDNPYQDLPLMAVLRSPFAGFTDEEIAALGLVGKGRSFCEVLLMEELPVSTEGLYSQRTEEKRKKFLSLLDYFRERMDEMTIHDLIFEILEQTGYQDYCRILPGGEKRSGNLDMLLEKAIAFEKTSYYGLFHFIRYIDRLEEYEVDYGEAEIIGENEDAVRIMSIHKSKGLEFPIVFLGGLGRNFNRQDARSTCIIHPEYGMGMDFLDPENRIKRPTLFKRILARLTDLDNLGEELRVLYVALTRAKEKLILTGTLKDFDTVMTRTEERSRGEAELSYLSRSSASTFLDWIIPALFLKERAECIHKFEPEEMVIEDLEEKYRRRTIFDQMTQWDERAKEGVALVEECLNFQYPYQKEVFQVQKYSVSELKHRSMAALLEKEEAERGQLQLEPIEAAFVPSFIKKSEEVNPGALRGTATHRLLECLPLSELVKSQDRSIFFREQVKELVDQGKLTEEQAGWIDERKLLQFYDSPLAERMAKAEERNELYLEMPFVMSRPAFEVDEGAGDAPVLIQGIIDVFFEEEDALVLVDYKTDKVDTERELQERYQTQMLLYAKALEGSFQKSVKEIILYSFHLQKEIEISLNS